MGRVIAEYNRLIWSSKIVSQIGVLILAIVTVYELLKPMDIRHEKALANEDTLRTVLRVVVLELIIVLTLAIRFSIFFFHKVKGSMIVVVTWWMVFIALMLYYAEVNLHGQYFAVYTTYHNQLELMWLIFLVISSIRFLVTGAFSILKVRTKVFA